MRELAARLAAVEHLHRGYPIDDGIEVCLECRQPHPCATWRALHPEEAGHAE